MRRIYEPLLKEHFSHYEQMMFLVGPRQVGKTTLAQLLQTLFQETAYFNWDVIKDRQKILAGQTFIEDYFPLQRLREQKPLIVFDELHKYREWKNYLKGFYDLYKDDYSILVTGSARLDIFQSGGDSLMGRYFQCRVHPISIRECIDAKRNTYRDLSTEIVQPNRIDDDNFNSLYQYGGFPKPFLERNQRFFHRWQSLRQRQLLTEDIKSLTHLQEISQLEILAELLKHQVGQMINRSNLSNKVQVSVQTVARWIATLERFYYCFLITPWSKNISRSLIKEPKIYLWDWSVLEDEGKRFENFIASHLLKSVHHWNDLGLGNYTLHYLRNKDKKEVDFLITKNQKPWILVEAKSSNNQKVSPALEYFQSETQAPYAFQVVLNMDYVDKDCFQFHVPYIVPARTFLSQLI